jgi:ActR/RegA family two-component response regulator
MRSLATTPPHLLITEIRLDSYNGLHLIAMAPKPIPAIVITGYPDRAVEADARRLGAEYLAKPGLSGRVVCDGAANIVDRDARCLPAPAR